MALSKRQLRNRLQEWTADLNDHVDSLREVAASYTNPEKNADKLDKESWKTNDLLGATETLILELNELNKSVAKSISDIEKEKRERMRLSLAVWALVVAVFLQIVISIAPNEVKKKLFNRLASHTFIAWVLGDLDDINEVDDAVNRDDLTASSGG